MLVQFIIGLRCLFPRLHMSFPIHQIIRPKRKSTVPCLSAPWRIGSSSLKTKPTQRHTLCMQILFMYADCTFHKAGTSRKESISKKTIAGQ